MTREELELAPESTTTQATVEISPELLTKVTEAYGNVAQVTPYRMSKVLSSLHHKKVQGPMMYNYRNKSHGFKATLNSTGHWVVDTTDAIEFTARFLAKNAK
jgi:hypothetical protein